jgi:hypothetical protein
MGVTVTVRDQVGTRSESGDGMRLDVEAATTVRDLIRTRVREEVAVANARAARGDDFRTLVQPVDAEVTLNGYRLRAGRTIDWQKQADKAEEAFERGSFFLLVDRRQPAGLDEELALTADSDIRFIRLVPLVGG